jgi:LmbE family N-acetylglucosaminyl deacetylase
MAAATGSGRAQVRYESNTITRHVFLVAHQDDWQLFMGDEASEIIKSGAHTSFIYLTAGDDGREPAYWQTRELAALQSTQAAMGQPTGVSGINCASVVVVERTVRKCSIGSVDSYFLRLPDGRRNGAGFSRYGNQSLRLLRAKKLSAMTSVDGSATYRSWSDLVATVSQLISGDGGKEILVHTTDPSKVSNPHDHFDHRAAGLMVEELRKRYGLNARYYVGYALATKAPNRTSQQTREKTEVFIAYNSEMMRVDTTWSAFKEHPTFYTECMERTYARAPKVQSRIHGDESR